MVRVRLFVNRFRRCFNLYVFCVLGERGRVVYARKLVVLTPTMSARDTLDYNGSKHPNVRDIHGRIALKHTVSRIVDPSSALRICTGRIVSLSLIER
jgi:hypothetical protein